MPTKNLVPRQDGEGKIGVKGVDLTLKWKEINAISGSLDTVNLNEINNLSGQPLLVPGSGITISHAEDPQNGYQYTISSSSSGFSDKIEEGQAKVEVVDTDGNDDATIQFWADPNDDGVSSKIWEFDKDGHLIPDINEEYDIGKAEKKVRHLFLSNNSLHIGTTSTDDTQWATGGADIHKLGKNDSHQLVWNTNGTENIIATLSNGQSLHPVATSGEYSDLANKPAIPSSSDDLTSDHNPTNYTGSLNASLTTHLSGIDTVLGTLVSDKVTQADIDAAIQGLDIKPSVRVATTQTLSATFTYDITTQQWQENTASGELTIDDVVLTNGNRVLVKNASSQTQNGIYVVSGIDGTSQVILDRSSDLDNSSDFGGAFTFVEEGTTNSGNSYVAKNESSPNSTTVGTNTQNWTQFNSAGSVTALNDLSDVTYNTGTLDIDNLSTLKFNTSGSNSRSYTTYASDYFSLYGTNTTNTNIKPAIELSKNSISNDASIATYVSSLNLRPLAYTKGTSLTLRSTVASSADAGSVIDASFQAVSSIYDVRSDSDGVLIQMGYNQESDNPPTEGEPSLMIRNTNVQLRQGPSLNLENYSGSSALVSLTPNRVAGKIKFRALSGYSTFLKNTAIIESNIIDPGSATGGTPEDDFSGDLKFYISVSGSLTEALSINSTSDFVTDSTDGDASPYHTVNVVNHDGVNNGLSLSGSLVTSTADELNILDVHNQIPAENDILTWTSGNGLHWAAGGAGGISSVEEDSNPVLGGDLNVRNTADSTNYKITASAGDLVLGVNASNGEFIITANHPDRASELQAFKIINGQYSNSNANGGNQIQAIGNMSLNPISGASSSVTSLRLRGDDEASIVLGETNSVKISRDANDANRPNTVQISNTNEETADNSPDLEIYSDSTTASNSSRIRFTRELTTATSLGELSSFILNTEYNRVNFDRDNTDGVIKLGVLSSSVIREGIKIQGSSGDAQVRISDAFNLPTTAGSSGQVLSSNGSGQTAWAPVPSPFSTVSASSATVNLTQANVFVNLSGQNTDVVTVNLPTNASDGDIVVLTRPAGNSGITVRPSGQFTYVAVMYQNVLVKNVELTPGNRGSIILSFDGTNWIVPHTQNSIVRQSLPSLTIAARNFGAETLYFDRSGNFTLNFNFNANSLIEGMHQQIFIRGSKDVTITSTGTDIVDPTGSASSPTLASSITLSGQTGIIDVYVYAASSSTNYFMINPSPTGGSSSSVSRPIFETITANSATITAPASVDELERVVLFNPTTAISVTLPDIGSVSAINSQDGFKYQLKNKSNNTITVNTSGGNVIDSTLSQLTLNQDDNYTIIAVGNNDWHII